MRFLVRLEASVPSDIDPGELARLDAAEAARGVELLRTGTIEHIWRVRGRRANAGVWSVESLDGLHVVLASLPMWQYLEVAGIEVLDEHPVFAAANGHERVNH